MVLKDVRPIIEELVRLKKSIPLEIDVGRYFPEIRKNTYGEAVRAGIKKALRAIEQAPTIDAEPVRHGEWGETQIIGYDSKYAVYTKPCSVCGHLTEMYMPSFCPACGAKMDGGKKDG